MQDEMFHQPEKMSNYSVFAKNCPSRMFFGKLADRWSFLVISLLIKEPKRFNQIRREIEGISQKVLTQKLRSLERDGMVHRRVWATVPVTVEYSLTELGESFSSVIDQLKNWAEQNVDAMLEARNLYDLKHDGRSDSASAESADKTSVKLNSSQRLK